MGAETKIQWTDFTFNPWIGCTKVSPGCKHCYAENTTRARVLRSQGQETWGKGAQRSRTSAANWKEPLRWNNLVIGPDGEPHPIELSGPGDRRPRVFCASLADWLDEEVPIEWFADLLEIIHQTPNLDWQLLTKRPENFRQRLHAARFCFEVGSPMSLWITRWIGFKDGYAVIPDNVWIGTTAETQECFNTRYTLLREIPARVRFWSMEPLLTSIDFTDIHYISSFKDGFHWVIVGGESGPKARHCHTDDVRDIVSQCEIAGVPCFVKQLGTNVVATGRDQKQLIAMKHPKGGDPAEWPEDLRVRQFPTREAALE